MACWAKAHGERKASTKSADHIAAIKSAKHIANELGHEDINFQLAKQRTRVTDARSRLVSYTKPDREQKQAAVDQAELALDMAQEALADNDKETASHAIDYAIIALDFATEIGPFGFGKALISVTTGKNPITGETLEPIDYVFAAVDILDPLGGTKIARKAAKYALEIISKSKKSRAVAEKILDGVKTVDKIAAKGKYPCALTLTTVGDCIPKNIPIGEITDEMIEKGRALGVTKNSEIKSYAKIHPGIETSGIPVSTSTGYRVRMGSEEKIAVIGRSMGSDPNFPKGVSDLRESLVKSGIDPNKVEIFSKDIKDIKSGNFVFSEEARLEFDLLRRQYQGNIPENIILESKVFSENKRWIEKLKYEGYTVIDMGNPNGREASIFYEMEKRIMWGQ